MSQRRDELITLLRAIPRSNAYVHQKEMQLKELQAMLRKCDEDLPRRMKELDDRVKKVKDFMDACQYSIDTKNAEKDELHKQCERCRAEIVKLSSEKQSLEKRTFAQFCKKHGIDDLKYVFLSICMVLILSPF